MSLSFPWMVSDFVFRASARLYSSVDTGITVNRFSQDLQIIDMQLPIAAFGTVIGKHVYGSPLDRDFQKNHIC